MRPITVDNIEAKVGTNNEYGRAQEKGTVGMAIRSRSRSGKPFTYIGNIKPKYYMKRAREDSGPDFEANMRQALEIIVKHLTK